MGDRLCNTIKETAEGSVFSHGHTALRFFVHRGRLRLHHPKMSNDIDNGVALNGVELIGYSDRNGRKSSLKDVIFPNERQEQEEEILGPSGTIRGVKNLIKQRQEALLRNETLSKTRQEPADEFLGKIIFYTTSMGGIRSTVDECRFVKKLFDNLNVEIDERDIFIHKEHQVELDRRLQEEKAPVPQVFVNGICLGGSKELLHLNETGELKELLSGFKKQRDVCARCGGFRFINCSSCNGSKRTRRMRISREINMLKCTKCNENGLLKCPDCAPEPVIII